MHTVSYHGPADAWQDNLVKCMSAVCRVPKSVCLLSSFTWETFRNLSIGTQIFFFFLTTTDLHPGHLSPQIAW